MAIISQVIVYIMVVFMAIAAIDRMFGSKLGLGDEFEGGFNAMGGLALGMGLIGFIDDYIKVSWSPPISSGRSSLPRWAPCSPPSGRTPVWPAL